MSATRPVRRSALLALALFASLLSCGREITGPGGRGALVGLNFAPDYSSMIDEVDGVAHSVAALVPFNRVRIELRRIDSTIAAAQVVDFPSTATEIPLTISVRLGDAAQDGAEPLTAYLRYINAAGDTVFAGGPVNVTARVQQRGQQPEPVLVPVSPTVPGAFFARIDIAPDTVVATSGQSASFTAVGYDGQDNVVPNAIIGFISRNPALVAVPSLGEGNVNLVGVRGSTWLIAQSLTGVQDSAYIEVLPRPSQLVKVSGDAQTTLTAAPFAQPLRVRVLAADGLPVADWPVNFAVTSGGGSVSAGFVASDSLGYAQVNWTAGLASGAASVTASIASPALTAVFTGTQLTTAPSSLAFLTQPVSSTAGISLNEIQVAVRNGAGETITDFSGPVSLGLTGGTAGAALVGVTTVAAVNGVATFTEVTVNRGGTNYRLTASYDQLPPAQSNTFNMAAAPASIATLLRGGGQSAPPNTQLADSIIVRVTDAFGFPVASVQMPFVVASGGGTVSAAERFTDADGRAGVTWTLGSAGVQQLRVGPEPLEIVVSAGLIGGGGGPAVLFAGFDSTSMRTGQSRSIPVFLSNTSDTSIAVSLSTNDVNLTWAVTDTAFAPLTQRLDLTLNASANTPDGNYWVFINSAAGDDSVQVTVTGAFLQFTDPFYTDVAPLDTFYTQVRLSDPAPVGGRLIRVRSSDPTMALVARGTGAGAPVPGCLDPVYCYYGAAATFDGVFDDSVDVFVREGEMTAQVAIAVVADSMSFGSTIGLTAEAAGFVGASQTYFLTLAQPILLGTQFGGGALPIGVGQRNDAYVYAEAGQVARDRTFRVRSLNPAVLLIDTLAVVPRLEIYSNSLTLQALSVGTAAVEFGNAQFGFDTSFVTVEASRIQVSFPSTSGTVGSERMMFYSVRSSSGVSGRPLNDLPITFTSRDPLVAQPNVGVSVLTASEYEAGITVSLLGAGSTYIVASAAGFAPDSFLVSVGAPAVVNNQQAIRRVGSNLVQPWTLDLVDRAGSITSPMRLTAQARNPGVTRVLTPAVDLTRENFGRATIQLAGVAPGADTVDIRIDGVLVGSFDFLVTTPRVALGVPGFPIDPDSSFIWTPAAYLTDSALTGWAPLDTVRAIVRSSDPTIVQVTDSLVTFAPGSLLPFDGLGYRALRPGTVTLSVVAPGFISQDASVTVRPDEIFASGSGAVGLGLGRLVYFSRNSSTAGALPLTVTQVGTGSIVFDPPLTEFPAGLETFYTYAYGATLGADTVIISAPNHTPDTLEFLVTESRARLNLPTVVGGDQVLSDVNVSFLAFETAGLVTQVERRLLLRSLDTLRARVEQDTIVVTPPGAGGERSGVVRFLDAGPVDFSLIDLDAALNGDTTGVEVRPRQLYGYTDFYETYQTLGMNQQTYAQEAFVELDFTADRDYWVTFTASRPGLITLPDSVRIPAGTSYAYFDMAGRDTVGTVRVTASIPGFIPWEFDVVVTNTQLVGSINQVFRGADAYLTMYAIDALELYDRPLASSVPIRVRSLAPQIASIIGTGDLTFPADSFFVSQRIVRGLELGEASLVIEDARPDTFNLLLSGTANVSVLAPTLYTGASRYLTTPGLRARSESHYVDASLVRDSVWVFVGSTLGRVEPVEDSILVTPLPFGGGEEIPSVRSLLRFGLDGISLGSDTLVFTAAGLPTAYATVSVEQGLLTPSASSPLSIVQGDSALLVAFVRTPDGYAAQTTTTQTLTATVSDTSLVVIDGAGNTLSAQPSFELGAGVTLLQVWVRGLTPGVGTVTIGGPNFRPLQLTYTVRAP